MTTTRSRIVSVALIISATLATTFLLLSLDFFSRIESTSFDHRAGLFRADKMMHPDVVVILIDEESLQAMDDSLGRWPWPRAAYRDLLEFFSIAGAQAFALDILFTERQDAAADNENDRALVEATRVAGNTVHAMQLLHSAVTGKRQSLPRDFSDRFALQSNSFVGPVYDDYLLPITDLYRASQGIGYLEIVPDDDGIYRRLRLFNQFAGGEILPGLASALVLPLVSNDRTVAVTPDFAEFGSLRVPLDGAGNYLINPYGGVNTYSAAQVFQSMQQIRNGQTDDLALDPALFDGKLVLLGASAIGLLDVKATAMAPAQAGVFLHAFAVSNILQQDFLILQPLSITLLIILLASCIGAIPVILISRLTLAALFPVTVAVFYFIGAYSAFAYSYIVPVTPVMFALTMSLLLAYSYRTYQEKHTRQKVRKMLGQYVSPNVLTAVIDSQEDLHAEVGTTESLSILFSDIRDFTNISESLEASKVVDLLNIYFSEMTEVIFEHDGTLDKFIGDAIMAFWGAPIKTEGHAVQALQSAIEMWDRLQQTNLVLESKNYPRIDIGIGIHSGEVVLGNIGSEKKLDYTIIGDSVNLASRLEGLTKVYGSPVIISESTWKAVHDSIPCILIDRVRVKGKLRSLELFAPLELFRKSNRLSISASDLQQQLRTAFDLYLERQWEPAAKIYGQIGECMLSKIFINRCEQFKSNEPEQDWNGVFIFSTK